MPGQPDRRRYQRLDPTTAWQARGSDPAARLSPDPLSPVPVPRPAVAPAWPARAQSGRTARRRRVRPVRRALFFPFRRLIVTYVRELLRALLPWLLPLALLASLPRIMSLLGGH